MPLRGGVEVTAVDHAGERHKARLAGRESVFAGPTDVAYVPRGAAPHRAQPRGGPGEDRALRREGRPSGRSRRRSGTWPSPRSPSSSAERARPRARCATSASRRCSTQTRSSPARSSRPAGNWSSYPPHKHDEERDGVETELEEIYYFEVRPSRRPAGERGSRRLPAGLRHRTRGPSTSSPRSAPVTSSSSRTGGTARRWRRPATTSTTST